MARAKNETKPVPGGVIEADPRFQTRAAYDIVGDVHGCYDELETLLSLAGWEVEAPGSGMRLTRAEHPDNRLLVFAGDLTDRGPASDRVLRLALGMMEQGTALWVRGNHDDKLGRWMLGNKVKIANGLATTIEQLEAVPADLLEKMRDRITALPHQIRLPMPAGHPRAGDGVLTVVHGAAPVKYHDRHTRDAFNRAIYAYPDDLRPDGTLRRKDWAAEYEGERWIVHGHEPRETPVEKNRVLNIDTGCVFGNRMTMFRVDTESFLWVDADRDYSGKGRVLD